MSTKNTKEEWVSYLRDICLINEGRERFHFNTCTIQNQLLATPGIGLLLSKINSLR